MLTRHSLNQTTQPILLCVGIMGAMLLSPIASRAAEVLPSRPHTITGQSGGNAYTSDCGYMSDTPSYSFRLTETSALAVRVESEAVSADMTLTIVGPDGRTCLDDMSNSMMPTYEGSWPAGEYELWVGDWGESQAFTLTFE